MTEEVFNQQISKIRKVLMEVMWGLGKEGSREVYKLESKEREVFFCNWLNSI